MTHKLGRLLIAMLALAALETNAASDPDRGAYLTVAAGCMACHTDSETNGPAFAGGHRLETPYGIFVSPNITQDQSTGIGNWSEAQFAAAMRSK